MTGVTVVGEVDWVPPDAEQPKLQLTTSVPAEIGVMTTGEVEIVPDTVDEEDVVIVALIHSLPV